MASVPIGGQPGQLPHSTATAASDSSAQSYSGAVSSSSTQPPQQQQVKLPPYDRHRAQKDVDYVVRKLEWMEREKIWPNGLRYLWTDAFGVVLFVSLYHETGARSWLDKAETVCADVYRVLGRERGLRIGEAADRDGQYFHYLTMWMFALSVLGQVYPKYTQMGIQLVKQVHAPFLARRKSDGQPKGIWWKMEEDLSGPHRDGYGLGSMDVFDGYVAYLALDPKGVELGEEIAELHALVQSSYPSMDVDQDLGLGMMLWLAHFHAHVRWTPHLPGPAPDAPSPAPGYEGSHGAAGDGGASSGGRERFDYNHMYAVGAAWAQHAIRASLSSLDDLWVDKGPLGGYFGRSSQEQGTIIAFANYGVAIGLQAVGAHPGRVTKLLDYFESFTSGDEYDREAITWVMACTAHFPGLFVSHPNVTYIRDAPAGGSIISSTSSTIGGGSQQPSQTGEGAASAAGSASAAPGSGSGGAYHQAKQQQQQLHSTSYDVYGGPGSGPHGSTATGTTAASGGHGYDYREQQHQSKRVSERSRSRSRSRSRERDEEAAFHGHGHHGHQKHSQQQQPQYGHGAGHQLL